ncbi:MAG: diguanylate cyclase, partial [Frankiales bacterium]|nr:diguanylate cyclase [Frankiales bacterium]
MIDRFKGGRQWSDLEGVDRGPGERRPAEAWRRIARRHARAARAGLYRPLAGDDDRVAYWVRHVRGGVLLSEVAAVAVLVYALLSPTPAYHDPVILILAPLVVLASPALLLLPLPAMMRDGRGPMLFYAWSVADTVLVMVAAWRDGGGNSPLITILFLTLAFMAVAYPPYGVLAMGALMTGCYLAVEATPSLSSAAVFVSVIMAAYTLICAMASANSWAAYDRQLQLLRMHEALAATDALTGCPNRRAFLERLGGAITAAATGGRSAVCLIDLDGFKAVNDRDGHAAGDAALVAVTAALTGAVRESDTVARLGGDEFAVLADVSLTVDADELAERLRNAVADAGRRCGVTASVGVALVDRADDVNLLLHRADAAMYRAKTSGGNRVT